MYGLLPTDVEGFDALAELELDMRWSWNHATDDVWRQLDAGVWDITHNPWVVLQTVSRDKIERVCEDPAFRGHVDGLLRTRREAIYLKQQLEDKLIEHRRYINKNGEDLPEVRNWKWDSFQQRAGRP